MLTGSLPQFVDPRKLADQGTRLEGQLTLSQLERLAEFRGADDEPVDVTLDFYRDDTGHHVVEGSVDTRLVLQCQRCLEPVDYRARTEVLLGMAWSNDQMRALPEAYDPLLIPSEPMLLTELVAEEVLVALPLAASHEQCPEKLVENNAEDPAEPEEQDQSDNPFAVLAQLKNDDSDRS